MHSQRNTIVQFLRTIVCRSIPKQVFTYAAPMMTTTTMMMMMMTIHLDAKRD
jgi:hypothetical protein